MNTKSVPTLYTLNEFTAAEILSFVGTNLLKQNAKSKFSHYLERCALRGSSGNKCAIGFLIPDEKYHQRMDYMGPVGPMLGSLKISTRHETMLKELQQIHDAYNVEDWRVSLLALASAYNCGDSVLKAFQEAGV